MKKIPTFLTPQIWLILLATIAIALSYAYIDRPLAFLSDKYNLQQYFVLKWLTYLNYPIGILILLSLPVLAIRFYSKKWGYNDRAALTVAISCAITIFFKDILKFIFGRYWPATWIDDNLSLLRDGAYGFRWFELNPAYQSFPSGHEALTAVAATSLVIFYPKLKYFGILIIALMALGQVAMNYHFLSDVMAGALLGYLVALKATYKF